MELDRSDTLDGPDEALHLVLERGAHRAPRDGQCNGDLDAAVVVNDDVAHHLELRNRLVQLGIDDLFERLEDRVSVGNHRFPSLPASQ